MIQEPSRPDQGIKRRLNNWLTRTPLKQKREWLESSELNRRVVCERERIDRRGGEFSFAICTFKEEIGADHIDTVSKVILNRLRISDEVGLLDPNSIGILYPDTEGDSAAFATSQIKDACSEVGLQFEFEVFVYSGQNEISENEFSGMKADSVEEQTEEYPTMQFFKELPLWKRSIDVIASVFALVVLSPLLLAVTIAIKIFSPGPVLFSQLREGHRGRIFTIYKFRTMRVNAELERQSLQVHSEQDGPAFKLENDPRVTKLGKFLRRSCIDELPQLINVVRGEMTLVGPRPLPISESRACQKWQRHRLDVVPGMTCIWQVEGGRHTKFDEWMQMDLRYSRIYSPQVDFKLIVRTILKVLKLKGSV